MNIKKYVSIFVVISLAIILNGCANSKYNKPDRLTFAGNFSAGHKYENGNAWVVNGFRDFKGAMGGHTKLPSKYSKQEHQKAYADFRENNGGVKPVRGFLRIMLATYTY